MFGIVLVTHGRLAIEFIAATEHVVGPLPQAATICISPDDDVELRRKDIEAAADKVNTGQGVVILTDMFGGTPSNLAISLLGREGVEVIAGMNLPMMIKLTTLRQADVKVSDAVLQAQEAGRKYINVASNLLAKSNDSAPAVKAASNS